MHSFHKCLATGVLVALVPLLATACGDDDRSADTSKEEDKVVEEPSDNDPASEEEEEDEGAKPDEDPEEEPRAEPMDAGTRADARAESGGDAAQSDAAQSDAARASDAGASSLCPALPTKFAIDGCGLPTLCHLKQDGCNWQAKCGTRTLTGSGAAADATSFAGFSHPDGRACTIKLTNGQLTGNCTGGDAGMCTFTTNTSPIPTPFCVDLPAKLSSLNVCSAPPSGAQNFVAQECDVIQSGCSFQASCNGGADIIAGTATNDGLRWDTAFGYRCTGALSNGSVSGNCVQRTGVPDGGTPATCPFSLAAQPTAPADCAQDLPTKGYVMTGCNLEGSICHLSQRGCIWQAQCGSELFAGRSPESGKYVFKSRLGANCTGEVKDGAFVGGCSWGAGESCTFGRGTPQAVGECYTAPALGFSTNGCASDMTCEDLVQSGCKWQTRCTFGGSTRIYGGTSVANGVKFASGNYQCWAYEQEGNASLVGACSTNGQEVSQCSPRVNNGTMTLTPRTAAQ